MIKRIRKIFILTMIIMLIAQINIISFAKFESGDNVNLKCKRRLDCLLQFYKEASSTWTYKVAYYIYGTAENGTKVPAFCVERAKKGVGELGNYDVTLEECTDDGIYTILYLYNNKKYSDWNLKNDDDYYLAVQTAMHSYSEGKHPKEEYRVGNTVLEGYTPNNIEEIKSRGEAVLNTAESLYASAINKEYKYNKFNVSLKKIGDWQEETINNEEVFSIKYEVISNANMDYYCIEKSNDLIKILDSKNIEQNGKISDKNIKLVIPKSKVISTNSINSNITINAVTSSIPAVLYARSGKDNKQDYAIYVDKVEKAKFEAEIKFIPEISRVILEKIDKENNKPLEGAQFEIYKIVKDNSEKLDKNNLVLTTKTTNKAGNVVFKINEPGEYFAVEKKAPTGYKLSNKKYEFKVTIGLKPKDVIVKAYNVLAKVDLNIEKTGTKETESGKIIDYEFENMENKSNVSVDNFTWRDVLPIDSVRLTQISTGTWNENKTFSIWYKTNVNKEYKLFKEGFNTKDNTTIDIEEFNLSENEYITEYELRFGTVKSGFKTEQNPKIKCKVLDNLKSGHTFINHTYLTATYDNKKIERNDEWKTVVYNKEIPKTKKLPKTGF